MRFVFGPIPPSESFDPIEQGWTPLVSTHSIRWLAIVSHLILLSLIIAGCLCLQRAAQSPDVNPWIIVAMLIAPALFVVLHEMIHCLAYRVPLVSRSLITGFWPSRGVWYVVYDGPLPRNQVLGMLIAPLICLSLVPALLITPFLAQGYRWASDYLLLLHTAMCVGDTITFCRILRLVPADAFIHNSGWVTCWQQAVDVVPRDRSGIAVINEKGPSS